MAQLVKNPPVMWETWVRSLGWEDPPGEGNSYPLQYSGLENSMDCIVPGVIKSHTTEQLSLSCMRWVSLVAQSVCNAGDLGLIPGLGRSPGEGNGNLLQYSCLENSMDSGA